MVQMSREDFEQAVDDAIDRVPGELLDLVDNVVILIEDEPDGESRSSLASTTGCRSRTGGDWGFGELPDRIFIYRNPTLACATRSTR